MFCKNCGKEIDNNSKFCSNCGYNFESENPAEKVIASKKRDKLNAAFALNIIALGVVLAFIVANNVVSDASDSDEFIIYFDELFTGRLIDVAPAWTIILTIVTSIVGFIAKVILSNNKAQKGIVYLYLIFTLLTTMFTVIGSVSVFPFMLCLIGLIYFVPAILLIIASVKFFQATK